MAYRVTTQQVEKYVRAQRVVEDQKRDLNRYAMENNKLLSAAKSLTKVEARRSLAQQQSAQVQEEMKAKVQQDDYQRRYQERTALQNQALATELDKQKAEEERKIREIQRICENSPELRELEQALKIAYLNKERKEQVEEKILLATREQERIQAIEDQIEYDRLRAIQSEKENMALKRDQYAQQRYILQQQIDERKQQLLELEREKEYDRLMVEDIVNQINQEDEDEYRKKREMQQKAAQLMQEFEMQRKREKELQAAREKAEEDAILAYQKASLDRNNDIAAKKQAKKDEDDRILQQIMEENEIKRKADEEFIMLRDMLWEEELEAKRAAEARNRQERQLSMKRDMMAANERMLQLKEQKRQQEAEQEARIVALMKQKFAEDEAKEREEERIRQEARNRYMKMIEQQKYEKRDLYNMERERELAELEEERRKEEYRKKVIQEARKRLIAEHAENLQGYLAPRVLSNQEEVEILRRASSNY
jgi:hypothetical protein